MLLLDLWGKKQDQGAVFADITWVGVTAARVPDEAARAFRRDRRRARRGRRLVVEDAPGTGGTCADGKSIGRPGPC